MFVFLITIFFLLLPIFASLHVRIRDTGSRHASIRSNTMELEIYMLSFWVKASDDEPDISASSPTIPQCMAGGKYGCTPE